MARKKQNIPSKDLISLAMYELVLRNKDYESIKVQDICDKAGVSRMTFYRYYNNKADVFIDYSDERFAEFFDQIKTIKKIDIDTFLVKLFAFCSRYKRQIIILTKSKEEQAILFQFENYIRYLASKSPTYPFNKDNPVEIHFISGGLYYVLLNWLQSNNKTTPEEMAIYFKELLTKSYFSSGR